MKKMTGMMLAGVMMAAVMVLVIAGPAFAWCNGPGTGYGPGCYRSADSETMKKFQTETLSLRDELVTKRIDLRTEYDKPQPDNARIASLEKDITDIRAKIQAIADKHGLPAWGPGSRGGMMGYGGRSGRGMMMRADCPCTRY